nr:hypothetical protein [Dyadobacter sp. NIV53]
MDLNTGVVGVANEGAACSTTLSFTKPSQTNISASNNLTELDISYLRTDIKDGANEQLLINGTTSGIAAHALNFTSGSVDSLEIGGVTFRYTKSFTAISGIVTNKIAFTKTSGGITFTNVQAETLLDALRYNDFSDVPTAGDRRFTVNVINSTFKSPNAVFTATINCVTIGGHIYRDQNGLAGTTDFNTISANSAVGQFPANSVYAVLVNPANDQVIASQGIAAGGAYTFGTAIPGNYILYIANEQQIPGTVFTAATFPSGGYTSVGENLDANPGSDLLNDGKLSLTVGSAPITNANFGLNIPPVAIPVTAAPQANPGGLQKVIVPTLSGTDPEQAVLQGGQGNGIRLTSLPVNGVLYYNNVAVNPENPVIAIYNPALLSVDVDDGALTFSFNYKQIDAAGSLSTNEATLTMFFTDITITGNVIHDPNGITNGLLDGTPVSEIESRQLYVNLIEHATGFVSGSSAVINGSYIFGTANGLQFNTDFDLLISTVQGIAGTITGAVSTLPVGWASTAEGSETGDGTPDGLLQISLSSTGISTGMDFGLQQLPDAGAGSTAFPNESGEANVIVPPNSFTSMLPSLDMDGSIAGLRITNFPDEAMSITVAETSFNKTISEEVNALLDLTVPTDGNGNPTVSIAIDPASDSQVLIDIPFVVVDNSGAVSSNTGHALLNLSGALPVTLISFRANKEGMGVSLNWSTVEEINSERFDIQHSINAKSWAIIGSVKSFGNTNVRQDYSFMHANPVNSNNYYRLKMVDRVVNNRDATFTYSQIRSIEFKKRTMEYFIQILLLKNLLLIRQTGIQLSVLKFLMLPANLYFTKPETKWTIS